jgi:hypothetical protein
MFAATTSLSPAAAAQAIQPPPLPDRPEAADEAKTDIVVFGRGSVQIGTAGAASEGTVGGSDLLVRPLLRVGELLEAVPGMIAAQHSGSGKANQYFLRGFNLDHGSDFTTYIDGVQMNLRTHGHGQGYLDLNGLIPELVQREDYRKGPYRADGGDFALAGAAYLHTIAGFDHPWAAIETGSFGWGRMAAGGTTKAGDGALTLVGQAKVYNGPWEEKERLRNYTGFLKFSTMAADGKLDLSLHAYRGTWRPTEQIPERIIGSSVCEDAFCSPDPTARGKTTRLIANVQFAGDQTEANAYVQFYDWRMSSNPTYANADASSAQITQFDRRWIAGLRAKRDFALSQTLDITLGTENRLDSIADVGVFQSDARRFVNSLGAYQVDEASASAYAEAIWRPFPALRLIGGIRGDYYRYSVHGRDDAARMLGEGRGGDALVSPKLAAAYRIGDSFEFYANWGHGFHSNDVRGAVSETPVPVLVKGKGRELGLRFQRDGFTASAAYYWLDVGSELRFVGDSNAVEPSGASHRRGYELVAFWRPVQWIALDATYAASHARYEGGNYIPNAFENAASAGISLVTKKWEASLRLRHLGPYPLTEDNGLRDKGSTIVNARTAYSAGPFQIYAEVLNLFDSRNKDIAYYYDSYIPQFDAGPVEGRLSRVVEPRSFRVGLRRSF